MGDLKNNDSEREALISSSLNMIDARLKLLEKPDNITLLGRVQKKASFVALVVGIALSFISLFDVFVSRPKSELFRDMEEFNGAVNSVAKLRQEMIQVQFKSDNHEMNYAIGSMITPQILANIQYATALLPRLGEHVEIPQLIVLISEAINIYDWKSASELVDRAVSASNAPKSLQSEAWRYKAILLFSIGKIQDGRKAYETAFNMLRDEPAFGVDGARARIVADWAIAEITLGDCSEGEDRIKQFIEILRRPQITPPVRYALGSTLQRQLGNIQMSGKRCEISSDISLQ
ncbi:hypothetical protein ACQP3R_23335, partial [Bacillus inaquosorum]|uniref:hypothetical protein n=1 Tax=Bacillus inaquosorum TaxID=483913 RepID=UPI003CFCBCD6